ncbi:PREDICTED: uncharacterized protein LOC106740578 isoform X2 [Dinoponera quadriceps]|uniref:Uncharacterized protein LOC106740578 isoform X2 n=1 Tax=Dinoponera quadriceps TaxID=609295 RepID=A0A6P3WN48_DINQU|nr:PREDICTED: uncharacterized protein LOC106740578 isoform X2 [Dinoponera quadriceps]
MLFHIFAILSVAVFGSCIAEKFDLLVPTCARNSSDYNSCLKHAIKEAWPLFVAGLPAEFEFPPIDPFIYESDKYVFDNGGLHGEVTISNLTAEGLRLIRFVAIRTHFDDDIFRLAIDIRIPKIVTYGDCAAYGVFSGFRMGGKEGIRGTWDISGPVKNDTWIIEHFRTSPIVKSFNLKLDNFFEGNRELNELAHKFVNDNWPPIYRIVVQVSSDVWDTYFSKMLNRLFSKLSFSKVFPEEV